MRSGGESVVLFLTQFLSKFLEFFKIPLIGFDPGAFPRSCGCGRPGLGFGGAEPLGFSGETADLSSVSLSSPT